MKMLLRSLPVVLLFVTTASAQDPEVRRQAVELLERANAAALPASLPNLERVDTFRVLDAGSGPREGTFSRVVVQGTGRREEASFGGYHSIDVWTQGGNLATVSSHKVAPPEIETVVNITPIRLVSFDSEDVIHRIVTKAVGGKNARCIEFDTIEGQKIDNNELCFDPTNNSLILEKTGNDLIENSDFFSFSGGFFPSRIIYSFAGLRKLEISQTMTELTEAPENVLIAPPGAMTTHFCRTWRRAIGISMPQPKAGNGGRDYDVVVRGLIESDGQVHDAVVQEAELADLGAEALQLIKQWRFTPLICEGEPGQIEADFVLHFHGR
jgi:Gram-negative bacterial TonB protein C-terminal